MTKTTKKKHFDYIVALPQLNLSNLKNVRALEIVVSISDRGAISHALARKISEKSKRETIRYAMNRLDTDFDGAGNYAFEVPIGFTKNGIEVPQSDSSYRHIQEIILAEEMASRKGIKNTKGIQSFLGTAKSHLNFYYSHLPTNQ